MPIWIKGCVPCNRIKALYATSRDDPHKRRLHRILKDAHWRKRKGLQTKVEPDVIDEQIKELVEHEDAVRVKLELEGRGFTFGTSLYGVLHKIATGRRNYRRIEIWTNAAIDARRIVELHIGFTNAPPPFVYSIWTYDAHTDQLNMAGGWERDE